MTIYEKLHIHLHIKCKATSRCTKSYIHPGIYILRSVNQTTEETSIESVNQTTEETSIEVIQHYLHFKLTYGIRECHNIGHPWITCSKINLLEYPKKVNPNKRSLKER